MFAVIYNPKFYFVSKELFLNLLETLNIKPFLARSQCVRIDSLSCQLDFLDYLVSVACQSGFWFV